MKFCRMEPSASASFLLRQALCYRMFIYYCVGQNLPVPIWFKNVYDVTIPCKFSSR